MRRARKTSPVQIHGLLSDPDSIASKGSTKSRPPPVVGPDSTARKTTIPKSQSENGVKNGLSSKRVLEAEGSSSNTIPYGTALTTKCTMFETSNVGFIDNFTFSPTLSLLNLPNDAVEAMNDMVPMGPKINKVPTGNSDPFSNGIKHAGNNSEAYGKSMRMASRVDKGGLMGRARFRKQVLSPSKSPMGTTKKSKSIVCNLGADLVSCAEDLVEAANPINGDSGTDITAGGDTLAEAGPSQLRQDP